jgi:5-methylcytosine-specific restriction endonuclease McrA
MRKLTFPIHTPDGVLSACINGVADAALSSRLASIKNTLLATATEYDQYAKSNELHLISRVQNVGTVTKSELQSLYEDQMSTTRGTARPFYDALRSGAPHRKCPLCGVGTVTVLDHHLPKSKYPDLAVCPYNLIPACDFCNNAKKASFPKTADQQTIHPYYDDFTQEQWIYANLDISGPPALVFFVKAPSHWDTIKRARAQRHFEVVKLGHSYTSNANDDMILLRGHLEDIGKSQGVIGIQAHLEDQQSRHSARINSWQHVMYQTLANNTWFVKTGHLNIPRP